MFEVSNFTCFFLLEVIKHWASAVSDNMDNISHREVICYLDPKEIHEDMVVTVGKKWNAEFKQAGSLEDDPHWRRPITIMTQETVAKIRDVIMADRRVTEYYIATELGISDVQGVSTLCPKAPWTWFETDSAQHVKGKSWNILGTSQQFSS